MIEKEKIEYLSLPVTSIDEIVMERLDAVGREEIELSPEQRRRGEFELSLYYYLLRLTNNLLHS